MGISKEDKAVLQEMVADIKNTRTRNNTNWMRILEIAITNAPEESLESLQGIRECDGIIQDKFIALVDALEGIVNAKK